MIVMLVPFCGAAATGLVVTAGAINGVGVGVGVAVVDVELSDGVAVASGVGVSVGQAPQSSEQDEHDSPIDASHIPSPQYSAGVGVLVGVGEIGVGVGGGVGTTHTPTKHTVPPVHGQSAGHVEHVFPLEQIPSPHGVRKAITEPGKIMKNPIINKRSRTYFLDM